MTKQELIENVHKQCGGEMTKRSCAELVEACFSMMSASIRKEGRFSYPGFGTFTVRRRKARTGRNPQTGESIKIKASKTVGFRPAATLKERL